MIVSRALRRLSVRRSFISLQLRSHGDAPERGGEGEGISIHPTSLVHPDAVIGKGVSIGPFCTVGSAAKIGDACQLHTGSHIFGDSELGDHCVLEGGAIVGADLPGKTIMGSNNTIGRNAVIGIRCQDLKYKVTATTRNWTSIQASGGYLHLAVIKDMIFVDVTVDMALNSWKKNIQIASPNFGQGDECFLYVGCNNDIREYTSIHRSSKSSDQTVIGDNNLIMGSCHIAHDCKFGNNNIFANNTLFAGHVIVGDYAHTAGAVVVHQFCHIGSYSFIGGGSVIAQDVPKYVMVSGGRAELRGLNSEGLRRYGFSTTEIRSMRKAYQKIFMPHDTNSRGFEDRLSEVIRSMRKAYQKIFMPHDTNSRGFEDRLSEVEDDMDLAEYPVVHSMVQSIRDSFEHNRRGICKFRQWNGS